MGDESHLPEVTSKGCCLQCDKRVFSNQSRWKMPNGLYIHKECGLSCKKCKVRQVAAVYYDPSVVINGVDVSGFLEWAETFYTGKYLCDPCHLKISAEHRARQIVSWNSQNPDNQLIES
jgi:hypothetical protein